MKIEQKTACHVWDITIARTQCTAEELKLWLKKNTKKWGFQGEIGATTGYEHWQGRFSLITRLRLNTLIKTFPWKGDENGSVRLSYTSNNARQELNFYNYVLKDDMTATGERYSDMDLYTPRQIRKINKLRLWQEKIIEKIEQPDDDHINVIIDQEGYSGKSTLALWAECHKLGFAMPPVSDMKDIMQIAMEIKPQKCYFIDIPRSVDQTKMTSFWAGIECLKRGKVYDLRYKYRQKLIDSPHIWVFMNQMPNLQAITNRRWKLWKIEEEELIRHKPGNEHITFS